MTPDERAAIAPFLRWAEAVVPHYDDAQAAAWFGSGGMFTTVTVADLRRLRDVCHTEQLTFSP